MTLRNLSTLPIIVLAALAFALLAVACTTATVDDSLAGSSENNPTQTPVVLPTTSTRADGIQSLSTPELVELLTPSIVQIAVNLGRGQGVGTGVTSMKRA